MATSRTASLGIRPLQQAKPRSMLTAAETSRPPVYPLTTAPVLFAQTGFITRVSAPSGYGFKERGRRQCRPNSQVRHSFGATTMQSATAPIEADERSFCTVEPILVAEQLAEALARDIERLPVGIESHPVFNAYDSPQMVALLVRSLEHSTRCFPSYLAFAAVHVHHDEIRSTIISQLNDELGNGRWIEDGHANLLKTMVNGLNREVGELVPQDVLTAPGSPAHTLKKVFDEGYRNPDSLRMLGAFMVAEALAKHFDVALLEAIKRHMANGSLNLSSKELRWITLHAELEAEHEGEVLEMCRLLKELDARTVERVRAGAEAFVGGFYAFLDDLCRSYAHLGQKT